MFGIPPYSDSFHVMLVSSHACNKTAEEYVIFYHFGELLRLHNDTEVIISDGRSMFLSFQYQSFYIYLLRKSQAKHHLYNERAFQWP
jgi:hypothetical protein